MSFKVGLKDDLPPPPEGEVEPEDNSPRNILEEIVWHKAVEIEKWRDAQDLATLTRAAARALPARDFRGALRAALERTGKPGLIAEVKKRSPSRGLLQPDFDPVRIAREYEEGGAACLSVLTDEKYFGGGFENLDLVRRAGVACPLLCKEFVVEPYQIFKGRAAGADAVLLIAAVLPNSDLQYLMKVAKSVGMQCLVEVHTEAELARVLELEGLEMVGINNRDLETFEVDLDCTRRLLAGDLGAQVRERGILMVGESGIFTPEHVSFVQDAGCEAILVGESLVKQTDACTGVRRLLSLE